MPHTATLLTTTTDLSFNSLFEMPNLSLFPCRVGYSVLSILYLRCPPADAAPKEAHNLLLSILYLRCVYCAGGGGSAAWPRSFNSLFEMHRQQWRNPARRRRQALSILYLRCDMPPPAILVRGVGKLSILYLRCGRPPARQAAPPAGRDFQFSI